MADPGQTSAGGQISWDYPRSEQRGDRAWYAAACAGLVLAIAGTALLVVSQLNRAPSPTYRILSGSMEPTLAVGSVVHVDSSAYASGAPQVGDIIAFHAPAGATAQTPECGVAHPPSEVCPQSTRSESEQIFIKRIVAAPGDTMAVVNGSVVRNGIVQLEPSATLCDGVATCNLPQAVSVPAGEWFVMGDNREHSDDSRSWGPVPKAWIVGKVVR